MAGWVLLLAGQDQRFTGLARVSGNPEANGRYQGPLRSVKDFEGTWGFDRDIQGLIVVKKAGSPAAVEPCERVGEHDRHGQDARSEDERVLGLAQIEAPHTTDKQVADDEVEKAPQDIHHRGGQAYPGR